MKQLLIVLATALPSMLFSQFYIEKSGAQISYGRSAIDIDVQTSFGQISEQSYGHQFNLGYDFYYSLSRRFSIGSGLLLQTTAHEFDSQTYLLNDENRKLSLDKISSTHLTVPLNLMVRTHIANSCVTFVSFGVNQKLQVLNKQDFTYEEMHDGTLSQRNANNYDSKNWKPSYGGMDIELGFGNFWYVPSLDIQCSIQPKINIYTYKPALEITEMPDSYIHKSYTDIYTSFRFEFAVYKTLDNLLY